jgi:uridine phosphorylase
VINSGAVRWGGSSLFYAPPEYPAVADPFLTVALADTCQRLKLTCHVGVIASIDSYYEGQGRQAARGREPVEGAARLELLRRLGVLNIDMETETLYTVGSVLGIKVANILVIHGNRATGDWFVNYGPAQLAMVGVVLESLERLYARLS